MNETTSLYDNIYEHVANPINCSNKGLHDGTFGQNKWLQEWKSTRENKISKLKDCDWFQRLIQFSGTVEGNMKWTYLIEHGFLDGDQEDCLGVLDTKRLQAFSLFEQCFPECITDKNWRLSSDYQQSNTFLSLNELKDDMTSILSMLKDKMDNEAEDKTGVCTNDINNIILSKIPNCISSTDSSYSMVNVNSGIHRVDESNENDKDVKLADLLIQHRLAHHTIKQQQSLIHDLKKKILNLAEKVGGRTGNVGSTFCEETFQLELNEAITFIHSQIDQLKNNESLIHKLKISKMKLTYKLEDAKKQRKTLEDSIAILRGLIEQLQINNSLFASQLTVTSDTDVLILHDSFLKHIKTDLLEKQQLIMENILCPHLSDALIQLRTYKDKPQVVILHTGTNDLATLQVEEMCDIVTDIHACATNNGMILIIAIITPSTDQLELAKKVHMFNSYIFSRLVGYGNVMLCQGNDLNDHNILSDEHEEDEYMRNDKTRNLMKLRRNKRFSISPYQQQQRGKENCNDNRQR